MNHSMSGGLFSMQLPPSTFHLIIAFVLASLTSGCHSGSDNFATQESAKSMAYEVPAEEEGAAFDDQQPSVMKVAIERKVIKTADYSIKVKDVNKSTAAVEQMAKDFQGFISSTNLTNSSYRISNNLTIRVPADRLDDLMLAIDKEAVYTNYKRVNAQDVTEEYLDIETRLNTKKEVRDRYVDILRNKAKTVEDVLKAEEAIRVIQEEIESREGRLNYLKNQVSLSTINLELYQEVPYTPDLGQQSSFWTRLKQSAGNGWQLILDIALGLVTIWPLLLIGGLLFWGRKWIKRKVFGR